jgi:hypothetical protein
VSLRTATARAVRSTGPGGKTHRFDVNAGWNGVLASGALATGGVYVSDINVLVTSGNPVGLNRPPACPPNGGGNHYCMLDDISLVTTSTLLPPAAPPPVLSEALYAGGSQGQPTQPVGADCSANRSSACMSGLCLKTTESLSGSGWICSAICQRASDCPPRWLCLRTLPDLEGLTCIPPSPGGTP